MNDDQPYVSGLAFVSDKQRVTKLMRKTNKPHIYSYRFASGAALWLWVGDWDNQVALFCDYLDEAHGYEN